MIVSASGPDLVYWMNAATFLFSVLLLLRIPAGCCRASRRSRAVTGVTSPTGSARSGARAALLTVLVAFGFAMLATGLINVSRSSSPSER